MEEVDKAIVGGGIFELVPAYEPLQVKDDKWWEMTQDQKERQLHRFHTCSLKEPASEDIVQYKHRRHMTHLHVFRFFINAFKSKFCSNRNYLLP